MKKEDFPLRYEDTGFSYSMSLISGKYKLPILYALYRNGEFRYNELKRFLDPISFKTLTTNLKDLESNDLIVKKDYNEIPPKVGYYLSERGESLIPILGALCDWGSKNSNKNN